MDPAESRSFSLCSSWTIPAASSRFIKCVIPDLPLFLLAFGVVYEWVYHITLSKADHSVARLLRFVSSDSELSLSCPVC